MTTGRINQVTIVKGFFFFLFHTARTFFQNTEKTANGEKDERDKNEKRKNPTDVRPEAKHGVVCFQRQLVSFIWDYVENQSAAHGSTE